MPRFTIRQMMIIVATLAATFGLAISVIRSSHSAAIYQQRVREHASQASLCRDLSEKADRFWTERVHAKDPENWEYREAAEWVRRLCDYHELMTQKYERAARYPWLPVEPDPPMPE